MIDVTIDEPNQSTEYRIPQRRWTGKEENPFNIFERPAITNLADKLRSFEKFGSKYDITLGSKPFQVGKGEPPQTDEIVSEKPYVSDEKENPEFRPLLRGSQIRRYLNCWENNYWVDFGDHLAEPRRSAKYDADEKMVIRRTDDSLMATLDENQFVITNSAYTLVPIDENEDVKYSLSLLNSQLLTWFYQNILNPEVGEALAEVKRKYLAQLPIPSADDSDRESLTSLVTDIIGFKQKRHGLNLDLLDYLGTYEDGPTLGERYQPASGLAESVLTDTVADSEFAKLRVTGAQVERDGDRLRVLAVPYVKPEDAGRGEYETLDPVPAMDFFGLDPAQANLIEAFVPHAVENENAGYSDTAMTTISPLDRLEDLTLPKLADVEGGIERYMDARERAAELDEKIERTDELIDEIVYELYGLTEDEIQIVEEAVDG